MSSHIKTSRTASCYRKSGLVGSQSKSAKKVCNWIQQINNLVLRLRMLLISTINRYIWMLS